MLIDVILVGVVWLIMALVAIYGKWVMAAFAILTGNKEALHLSGSLCEDDDKYIAFTESQWQRDWDDVKTWQERHGKR